MEGPQMYVIRNMISALYGGSAGFASAGLDAPFVARAVVNAGRR